MKFSIDVVSRRFVLAHPGLEESTFICPQCSTYVNLKLGRGGRYAYFAHSRGHGRGCTHKDKDLFPLLIDGNEREVMETTEGWIQYLRRIAREKRR